MPIETGLTRAEIVNRLNLSLHGDLAGYTQIIGHACITDPEFLAHLIAFDFTNGQIKDSKLALPVITLATKQFPDELVENSLAHLALQSPREILRALEFSITSNAPSSRQRRLEKMIRAYLDHKQAIPEKWMRWAARHRRALQALYSKTHAKAPQWASTALFGRYKGADGQWVKASYAQGSIFADIANLSKMPPELVAATIQKWHLSPLIVGGAMTGSKAAQENAGVVQAGMEQMSDTELITRAASLEKKGAARGTLKEAFRKKVSKAVSSKKATLKTSVAADIVEDDGMKVMLRELQERQIQSQKDAGRGIDGNWLVIGDRSSSQDIAISLGVQIAAAIAKFVTGKVWLVFCAAEPMPIEVTGKTLEEIQHAARFVVAYGPTSYGVGLDWAATKSLDLDGVAIVGDGGENTAPVFAEAHKGYQHRFNKSLPVYFYQTYCTPAYAAQPGGNPKNFSNYMGLASIPFTTFDLTSGKVDYYSLPNLVQSMNASRFGVVEKIMACPLLTLDQVFGKVVVGA